jgi:hypothetical protein
MQSPAHPQQIAVLRTDLDSTIGFRVLEASESPHLARNTLPRRGEGGFFDDAVGRRLDDRTFKHRSGVGVCSSRSVIARDCISEGEAASPIVPFYLHKSFRS